MLLIVGLFLDNISVSGSCNAAFACNSLTRKDVGGPGDPKHYQLFATGSATNVDINGQPGIASPVHCHFLGQPPPPPPPPPVACTVAKNLGCFNSTTAQQQQALLPSYRAQLHDHVTLEACAAACSGVSEAAAGIRDGNHCYCGARAALATPAALALSRPLSECLLPPAQCPCGPAKTHGCACRCSGNFSESCGNTDRMLAFSFVCKPPLA